MLVCKKKRRFLLLGHSFSFHALSSGCLTAVLQLKFLMLKEVNAFLQHPGKRVNTQTLGMTSGKELVLCLIDFLSLVHGLKGWQYWHSYTNSALATMHQALPGFCLLSFSSPCDFCPHMSCVMYRRGAWVRVAKALCWGEHIYHLCYSVTAQLRHSFTVLPLSPQALAHFLWGDKENKPKIRCFSSAFFNNLE